MYNNHESYVNIKNRNNKVRELKQHGKRYYVRTSRNQLMHPQYIKDWEGTYQTGLGNMDYKTYIKALYSVEWEG